MKSQPKMEDLRLFGQVVRMSSFAAVAKAMGVSPAFVGKRVQVLESTLGVKLLHRQARRLRVTEEGARVDHWAQHLLGGMESMLDELDSIRSQPRGLVRMASSLGFGRRHVAPGLAGLIERYPGLQVRLELVDDLREPPGGSFDLDIRIGNELAPHVVARKLAGNHRVLCAAPRYLARRGMPMQPADLARHDCLVIKERDQPFGVWRLSGPDGEVSVKVAGLMSSNDGEVVRHWALQGHGIMLRSMWDVGPLLRERALLEVLPGFRQAADIWAVYPVKLSESARLRVCVEWLQARFQSLAAGCDGG